MNHRCVPAGHPVGQRHIARSSLFGGFHQTHDFSQQGVLAHGADLDDDGGRKVKGSGENPGSGRNGKRRGFTVNQPRIHIAVARCNGSIDGYALTGGGKHFHAGRHFCGRNQATRAGCLNNGDCRGAQGEKVFRRAARLAARTLVQIATDQQEKQ